ncbi:MAG: response regulator [Gammaproteobacteria bacterium]|nr:response regulator [Gammaproteobacteria bacterium]
MLIVDDSRTQIYSTKKILNDYGFSVITAEDGKAGIIKARDIKPDLILMDIVMPVINGFQATRYLKKHPETSQIPIIIVSSSTQESDKAWGLKLGACDFVTKPTEAGLLIAKIIRHLDARPQYSSSDMLASQKAS